MVVIQYRACPIRKMTPTTLHDLACIIALGAVLIYLVMR